MNQKKSNVTILMERIEQCFFEYRAEVAMLGGVYIFDNASEIAAVRDVYFILKGIDWPNEETAAYLLRFANPLKYLADEWREYSLENSSDFEDFTDDFEEKSDTMFGLTYEEADELLDRHKGDTPVNMEFLMEIVDICEKYLKINIQSLLNLEKAS